MKKSYPFLIDANASGESLKAIDNRERVYDESWLQELLRRHPDILPVAEIEPVFYPLIPIGREVVTETGAIDNLFISNRGYLVLVETKLWRNPEAKREVVAQAIDYGSSISKWGYSKLNNAVREYTKRFEKVEMNLTDWIEQQGGPIENGRDFFEETVAKNLRLGRFLIVIVGDRIRQSVIEMVSYVNKYPHLATDIVLVELNCYHWQSEATWPLLVVPTIVARTEIVERSVIQVTLKPEGAYHVEVRQEGVQKKTGERKRVSLTEEAFWELLMEKAPEEYEQAQNLIEKYRIKDRVTVEPTESAIVVRLSIQDTGQQASIFFINKSGYLCVWPHTIRGQLVKAGLDRDLIEPYDAQLRDILRMPPDRIELACHISEVNLDDFIVAVDTFSENIQLAEPVD
jgi:hypothetical protein